MPDPPVSRRAPSRAAPSASRSRSSMASTTVSHSPLAALAASAARIDSAPAATACQATWPTGWRDWRASQRRRSGSVMGLSGMMLHARFREQPIADEEMALEDPAARLGKGRADRHALAAQGLGQGFAHRPDIAFRRGIEGRAIFEEILLHALIPQPVEGGQGLGNRLGRGDGAALEGDDPGLAIAGRRPLGHADELGGAEARLGEGIGEIAGAGEIIRDAAQQHALLSALPMISDAGRFSS